jgi:DNA invertase Pin-like site-specific DNA recombinase
MQQEFYTDKGMVEVRWGQSAEKKHIGGHPEHLKTIRVAAYCRVSTDLDEQADSFELQKRYYCRLIKNTPGWRLAGIYADQGITGTQCSQRTGFQRMIRHCEEGKIDRIFCKSISRFARNTVDLLETVRILKEQGVGVVFEKEGIDTLSIQSDFILSTIAAIAQEESRSISENMIWSFKKRFQQGIPVFKRILGYNIEKHGYEKAITINEEEAAVVREIYDLALQGMGYTAIARIMMRKGYKTVEGRSEWTTDSVRGILKNERYTGHVLCQKTYTANYLTHKTIRNKGERQQYLIENHHPAIISQETFENVGKLLFNNQKGKTRKRNVYPLSKRVLCGNCGATFHSYLSSNNRRWRCSRSIKSSQLCRTKPIGELEIRQLLLKAFDMRYDLRGRNAVNRLKIDIKMLQENDNIERNRAVLKKELAEALSRESHASIQEKLLAKEERKRIEESLGAQEEFWQLVEEDRGFRTKALDWLETLPRGIQQMKVFFEQFDVGYMRAWVISITILKPFSFSIKWFDNTDTMVILNE